MASGKHTSPDAGVLNGRSAQPASSMRKTLLLLILTWGTTLWSQTTPPRGVGGDSNNQNNPQSSSRRRISQAELDADKDTFNFTWSTFAQPLLRQNFEDSLPTASFTRHDLHRQQGLIGYSHLGHAGTPSRPLSFLPGAIFRRGVHAGLDAFAIHQLGPDQLRIWHTYKTYSEVYFSQQDVNRNNNTSGVRLGLAFSNGWYAALHYDRVSEAGLFQRSGSQHDNIVAGLRFTPDSSRYQAYVTYIGNTQRQAYNGGVDTAEFDALNVTQEVTTPVKLTTTVASRYFSRGGELNQQLRLANGVPFGLQHRARYTQQRFLHYAEKPDSSYFLDWYTDKRAIRNYLTLTSLENEFNLSWVDTGFNLRAGVIHQVHWLTQDAYSPTLQTFLLNGALDQLRLGPVLLTGAAHLALAGAQAGDYRLAGKLRVNVWRDWNLEGGLVTEAFSPTLLQQRLYLNGRSFWNNNFDRTFSQQISAALSNKQGRVELTWGLVNGLIWADSIGFFQQTTGALNYFRLSASYHLKWRWLRSEHQFTWQSLPASYLQLPEWYSRHNLYYLARPFKKRPTWISLGAELHLIAPWKPAGFWPLSGQFTSQSGFEQPLYPQLDAFVTLRVRTFRFFLRAENLAYLWESKPFYTTADYPTYYFRTRLGINWRFLD